MNLSSNQLDNTDLAKICEVIEGDSTLKKLLLASNQITDCLPLSELIRNNGRYLTYLDISNCLLDDESLHTLTAAV